MSDLNRVMIFVKAIDKANVRIKVINGRMIIISGLSKDTMLTINA